MPEAMTPYYSAPAGMPLLGVAAAGMAALVLVVALAAIARRSRGGGHAARAAAASATAAELMSVKVAREPSSAPLPSPPPSPPLAARHHHQESIADFGAFSITAEDLEMCSRMIFDDGCEDPSALPPAEEPGIKLNAAIGSLYHLDGIPPNCEGASAQEDMGPRGRDVPLFLADADFSLRGSPAAGPEPPRHAFPSTQVFDFAAPSVETELEVDEPARKRHAPCAEESFSLDEAEALLRDAIDQEVDECGAFWGAPSPADAQPPAGESPLTSPAPPSTRTYDVVGGAGYEPSYGHDRSPSDNLHSDAPAPAGESPLSASWALPGSQDWSHSGPHPPAFESPLASYDAHQPQPPAVACGKRSHSEQVAPAAASSCAAPSAAFAQQLQAQRALAMQVQLLNQLQATMPVTQPSPLQLQALVAAGVDLNLIRQLQQLQQIQSLAAQFAPAAAAPGAPPAAAFAAVPVALPFGFGRQGLAPAPDATAGTLVGAPSHAFPGVPDFATSHAVPAAAAAGAHAQPSAAMSTAAQMQGIQAHQHPHLPKPSPAATSELLQVWAEHSEEVAALAEKRKGQGQFERRSHRHYCQGCGRSKSGHRRSEVHAKCVDADCWCGVPRLLHPHVLSAGARCHGEWRDILTRHRNPAAPLLTPEEQEAMRTEKHVAHRCSPCAAA